MMSTTNTTCDPSTSRCRAGNGFLIQPTQRPVYGGCCSRSGQIACNLGLELGRPPYISAGCPFRLIVPASSTSLLVYHQGPGLTSLTAESWRLSRGIFSNRSKATAAASYRAGLASFVQTSTRQGWAAICRPIFGRNHLKFLVRTKGKTSHHNSVISEVLAISRQVSRGHLPRSSAIQSAPDAALMCGAKLANHSHRTFLHLASASPGPYLGLPSFLPAPYQP